MILHIPPENVGKRYSLNQLLRVYSDAVKTYRELNIGIGFMPGMLGISPQQTSDQGEFSDITEDMDGDAIVSYYKARKTDLSSLADIIPPGAFSEGDING